MPVKPVERLVTAKNPSLRRFWAARLQAGIRRSEPPAPQQDARTGRKDNSTKKRPLNCEGNAIKPRGPPGAAVNDWSNELAAVTGNLNVGLALCLWWQHRFLVHGVSQGARKEGRSQPMCHLRPLVRNHRQARRPEAAPVRWRANPGWANRPFCCAARPGP